MKTEIIQKLNNINKEFYELVAPHFDSTRDYPWEGWKGILPFLNLETSPRVLDIGCGNGRFGLFLKERMPGFVGGNYWGVDSNKALIDLAQKSIPDSNFILDDVLDLPWSFATSEKFSLISAFGILHHIPSIKKRLEFLTETKKLLSDTGKVFFSTWEFIRAPNFPGNTVPFENFGINSNEMEEGDFLLTWKRGVEAVRYCHYISPEEVQSLCAESGLNIHKSYETGAGGDKYNRYFITSV